MDYTFLANLQMELAPPEDGILSRILRKDEKVNITLFGFSSGQELSAHSAPTPAILYFLDGEAEVQLGEDKVNAGPGSFVYMPPMLTHAISAKSPIRMLLIQIKAGTDRLSSESERELHSEVPYLTELEVETRTLCPDFVVTLGPYAP